MSVSSVKPYIFNTTIGAAVGGLVAAVFKNAQIWKSPYGGRIFCLVAERVAVNPLHIDMGATIAVTATVPNNYTLIGKVVPTLCTFNTLLISCIAIGILIGVCIALKNRKPAATPLTSI